jgi:hypothetical protein
MNREAYKFFSGSFAALAYAHGAYAVATSCGVIDEPVFLGRKWGVGYMWTEAVVYTAISVGLGYLGWRPNDQPTEPQVAPPATTADELRPAEPGAGTAQPATL